MRIVLTTMFEREHDTEFDYLEAWRELRYEPKWMALPGTNSNARPDKSALRLLVKTTALSRNSLRNRLMKSKNERPVSRSKKQHDRSRQAINGWRTLQRIWRNHLSGRQSLRKCEFQYYKNRRILDQLESQSNGTDGHDGFGGESGENVLRARNISPLVPQMIDEWRI
ncbi:hypothetical protein PI125_g12954 [Phytophthora idaei]|nr:hypothetical protein PI125_g12954 [Phytophthora idaei]